MISAGFKTRGKFNHSIAKYDFSISFVHVQRRVLTKVIANIDRLTPPHTRGSIPGNASVGTTMLAHWDNSIIGISHDRDDIRKISNHLQKKSQYFRDFAVVPVPNILSPQHRNSFLSPPYTTEFEFRLPVTGTQKLSRIGQIKDDISKILISDKISINNILSIS